MKLFFLAVSFFSSVKSAHFRNIDPAGYPKRRSFDAKILLPPAEELKKSFVTIKLEDFIDDKTFDLLYKTYVENLIIKHSKIK